MIPPTPEASGEPLSDARLAGLLEAAEYDTPITASHKRGFASALRELKQRRATSLPAAQGADVGDIAAELRGAALSASRYESTDHHHNNAVARLCKAAEQAAAALDARLSPPQAGEPKACLCYDDSSASPCPVHLEETLSQEDIDWMNAPMGPKGAPEASVDLAQIARETLEAIGAQDAYDTLEEWEAAHLPVVLAALQRAREVQK